MRQAKPSDAPQVASLFRQAAERGYGLLSPDEVDEEATALDLAEGLGLRIVADRGGEILAFLTVMVDQRERLSRTGDLQLIVRRDLQGKGIGAELMRYAITWAEGGALDRIEVFVRATNTRAIELYKRFGFVEEGRLRHRVRLADGTFSDDLVLGRLFERPLG